NSICINQRDITERSQQVKTMDQIYKNAACVLMYLGKEDDETSKAYDCLETLVSAPGNLIDPDTTLHALIQRPWFGRAWTFQEAVLAKRSRV
ncbi:heterokaryon incompatibility, partial [Clohesyomyces aquaticus]